MDENWWLTGAALVCSGIAALTGLAQGGLTLIQEEFALVPYSQPISCSSLQVETLVAEIPWAVDLEPVWFGARSVLQQTLLPAHCLLRVCLENSGLGVHCLSMGMFFFWTGLSLLVRAEMPALYISQVFPALLMRASQGYRVRALRNSNCFILVN